MCTDICRIEIIPDYAGVRLGGFHSITVYGYNILERMIDNMPRNQDFNRIVVYSVQPNIIIWYLVGNQIIRLTKLFGKYTVNIR